MGFTVINSDDIPPFFAYLNNKYYQKDHNCISVVYKSKKYVFYVLFTKNVQIDNIHVSSGIFNDGTNIDCETFYLDKHKFVETLKTKDKYRMSLIGLPILPGSISIFKYHGRVYMKEMECENSGFVTSKTQFGVRTTFDPDSLETLPFDPYISNRLIKMIRNRAILTNKSLLIIGSKGSGKSRIVKTLSKIMIRTRVFNIMVFLSQLEAKKYDYISDIFGISNGLVLIDDVHLLESYPNAIPIFVNYVHSISSQNVLIIYTSRDTPNSFSALMSSLFDISISLKSLSYEARLQTLEKYQFSEEEKANIAKETAGFSYRELYTVIRSLSGTVYSKEKMDSLLKTIMRSDNQIQIRRDSICPDVYGNEDILKEIRMIIDISLNGTDEKRSMLQCSGILLHGASGNGKSQIIKRMAYEFNVPFFDIEFDKVFSMYLGDSEKAIRDIFSSARFYQPCVIIIENIDAIGGKRSDESGVGGRVLSTLLNEMDGVLEKSRVFVIATTNSINLVDSALLRPGRIDRIIGIEYPHDENRIQVMDALKSRTPVDPSISSSELSKMTDGFSYSELFSFFRFAALKALKEGKGMVTIENFNDGICRVKARKSIQ